MKNRSLFCVHIAVLLFGFASIFSKVIPVSALLITLARALFSGLALYFFIHFRKISIRLIRIQDYFWSLLAGLFLTIHWFFFILSVQTASVSIGTITYATYPLFVVFIEPYVFKEKFQYKNLLSVIMIAIGVGFLIPAFHLDNTITLGIFYGLISSFSFAILSVINRRLASFYEGVVITFYEQTVVTIIITLLISIFKPPLGQGGWQDFVNLLILGIIFTGVAHSLYVHGLKGVKAQTASIISVLEPVYSIFLAIFFLHERLTYYEIIGVLLILVAVMIGTITNREEEIYEKIS